MAGDFAHEVSGIGALAEPARRALYLYVVAQPDPVSRDQAARGAGVARHTAKFHLEKLVDEGLLETEFRRLTGRSGPGAGRPAKLYRRSGREVQVSLPERHYDLAAQILARAMEEAARGGEPVLEVLGRVAGEAGRELAAGSLTGGSATGADDPAEPGAGAATADPPGLAAADDPADPGAGAATADPPGLAAADDPAGVPAPGALQALAAVLSTHGYEPRVEAGAVVMANCPFHALARDHTALVCGMNRHLVTALAHAMGGDAVQARFDPVPGRCCVTLTSRPPG